MTLFWLTEQHERTVHEAIAFLEVAVIVGTSTCLAWIRFILPLTEFSESAFSSLIHF